jgi:competence protein ComEC
VTLSRASALVRERPYHAAVGAFGGGLGLAATAPGWALPAAAGILLFLLWVRAPASGLACASLLLVGTGVGGARLAAIDAQARGLESGRALGARAHLLERPRPSEFGSRAEVRVVSGRLSGARLLARAPRWVRWPQGLAVGAELRVRGVVRRPRSAHDADFDFAAHLRRRGIVGELWLDSVIATGGRRGGVAGVLDSMRRRAERAVEAGMSSSDGELARGMVLGQDERIEPSTREDWRAAGLAHLLAVSGQNVMLLAALALPFLAAAGLGPRARGIALLCLVAVYVPLAGAGPSLQRAGVMGAAGIAAMTLSRPTSRWYALLLAAAATLALNPRACGEPGWQLSFAAVVGILTLGPPLRRIFTWAAAALLPRAEGGRAPPGPNGPGLSPGWDAPGPSPGRDAPGLSPGWDATGLSPGGDATCSSQGPDSTGPLPGGRIAALADRLGRGLAEGAAITVAATLATGPLLAHHFGSVSLAGLPANLLALPAVAPAMWLGMVKAGLGQVAAAIPQADLFARLLGPVARLPVAYLAGLAERFADVPGAQVGLPLRSPAQVAAAYALMAAAAAGVRAGRAVGPWAEEIAAAWRRRPRAQRLAVAAAALAALSLPVAQLMSGPGAPGELTIRFLDVGQGDATLIQHPDGTAVLFDGGPPEAGTARLLRRAGVRRLSLVVATHASRDHHGGLADVLDRYPVDLLLDGGDGARDPGFRALLAEAAARNVRRVRAVAPMIIRAGSLRITVLSPSPRPRGPPPEDPNPRAIVALVTAGGFDLLLSADAESDALLPLELPDVDAMKVPHHGSSDPGLPQVLRSVRPELAAIEVGPNTYGHPTPSTLAALERAGARTYRTDRDGTVSVTVDGGEAMVSTER